ncbi:MULTISPECIES: iron ABC transporter permease [Sporosarcina]|uniref:Probable heme-iron transport system permease protein IsdF n=1 Tax=Sporosarcina newyorkensis 2681 TaxID=1027292 RepID=F9DUX7_9BACL|nr:MULTISPECIES: iron ABC transporter permease [Sporosarcina]EGQ24026.1 iron (Fe) ABC superfamily ATP binding cassette transporter, membrane protein [Sporosarcina newyorkensis 2681]MBY0223400.1 iron ABC transporter permease [Sporosarcina aquimarina]
MTKRIVSYAVVAVLLIVTIVYSATTGSIKMGFFEFLGALFEPGNSQMEAIRDLRFPRMIVALFAGAALSVSGVLLQSVMRNPLADAGIIGISSGAAFVQLFIISFFPALFFMTPLFAFMGGAFACFLVFALSWRSGLSPLKLILVGIAINAMFTGLTEAFISFGGSLNVSASSVIGSNLTMRTWSDVSTIATYGTIGLILSFVLYSWCNLLVLQDKTAKSIGFHVTRARLIIAAVAVLLAAISVVVAGVISFVGLLVPHIARRLVGYDHKVLIPFTALLGALIILLADTIGRTIVSPLEIPASTIMAIIGGPFLIFLLRKE